MRTQLSRVRDPISASAYPNDIDGQAPNNYTYDAIGNLIGGVSEGMDMTWTVYGRFAQQYSQKILDGETTLEEALQLFFNDLGAAEPKEAPNFEYIPHIVNENTIRKFTSSSA